MFNLSYKFMKKKSECLGIYHYRWQKIGKMMKLCIILVCLFSFSLSATTLAQRERVSMKLQEVSLRQVLEQIVAKTSIPPFMLGLNWNSTERMSAQQADMLTTEITAIRRTLTPVVEQICRMRLRMQGETAAFRVDWEDINLQDEVEEAKAELYREQARKLRIENDAAEGTK